MVAKLSQKFIKRLIIFLSLFLIFTFAALSKNKIGSDEYLHAYYLDVGQGSATLLRYKNIDVLIDTGPDGKIIQKINQYLPWNDRNIELVILTHPHSDHIGGMDDVLKHYDVKRVLLSDVDYDSKTFQTLKQLVVEESSVVDYANKPLKYQFEDEFVLETLFPNKTFEFKKPKEIHDSMVVTKVTFKKKKLLFPGDLEKENELKLLGNEIDSDILLAGHHGSRTSSSTEFLNKVSPEYVVISSGEGNKYGHPHKEVLEGLEVLGLNSLRTDELGDIHFKVNKDELSHVSNP